jgi:hypothetical protein
MDSKFEIGDKSYFIKMGPQAIADAKKVHNKAFREALEDGALLRKSLMNHMRDQGVWDDRKEEAYQAFIKQISELEYKLSSGKMKVSEGRSLAIELSRVRGEFRNLISERNIMDANSAEGQADNARFNCLLVKSVFDYITQKPVYASVEAYVENGSDEVSLTIAGKFANFLYGVDEDYDKNLVENKFLKRFSLVDSEGRFLDKNGKFIDVDGNPVDAEGYRLDENGIRVDINGHHMDTNIDTAEFENDFSEPAEQAPQSETPESTSQDEPVV